MKDENKKLIDRYQAIYPEKISEQQAVDADNDFTSLISLLIQIDKS